MFLETGICARFARPEPVKAGCGPQAAWRPDAVQYTVSY